MGHQSDSQMRLRGLSCSEAHTTPRAWVSQCPEHALRRCSSGLERAQTFPGCLTARGQQARGAFGWGAGFLGPLFLQPPLFQLPWVTTVCPPDAILGGQPVLRGISTCLSELLPQEWGRWCPTALPPALSPESSGVAPGPSFQPQVPGQHGRCENGGLGHVHRQHLLTWRAGGPGPMEAPTHTGCIFIALSSHCRPTHRHAPGARGGPRAAHGRRVSKAESEDELRPRLPPRRVPGTCGWH